MSALISACIGSCAMGAGGVSDYKTRTIPNYVHILLLLSGIISIISFSFGPRILANRIFDHALGLAIPAGVMLAGYFSGRSLPGGDFKLLCTLGFQVGLAWLCIMMALAALIAVLVSKIKQIPTKRNIPLCSYLAVSYLAYLSVAIIDYFHV